MGMEKQAAGLEQIAQEEIDVGLIQAYVQQLPDKALRFGIRVLLALVAFFIGVQVIKLVRRIVRRSLKRGNADIGVSQFLDSFIKTVLYILLLFMIASGFGLDATSVVALLGSAGVAIGLAIQGSLSNFAGGVLILLLKPFVVGDYIIEDTNKDEGTVKEIQIFYTKLSTIDNKTIVIPNGILTNSSLTNATAKDERRLDLKVSISYQADLRKAKKLIEEILASDVCVMKDEEINVFVDDLAESAVVLGARAWVKNDEFWPTRWRLLETIKLTLDEHEIEIPYPQMTVHVKE